MQYILCCVAERIVKIMAKTIFKQAKELKEELGEEKAIAFYQKQLEELGTPKNFSEVCKQSALETAIDVIKGKF